MLPSAVAADDQVIWSFPCLLTVDIKMIGGTARRKTGKSKHKPNVCQTFKLWEEASSLTPKALRQLLHIDMVSLMLCTD